MNNLIRNIYASNNISFDELFEKRDRIYTFLNPYSYLLARKNKPVYRFFDGIFADGILLSSFISLLLGKKILRRSMDMTSIAVPLFNHCVEKSKTIAFVGAKQHELDKAIESIQQEYNGLNIIYRRNGYFNTTNDENDCIKEIISANPDFVLIGLGTPRQEQFLVKLKLRGYLGIGLTCGGFFHQTATAENVHYYPEWVDNLNIRFLYRMYKEGYTRKRYFEAFVKFLPLMFIDFVVAETRSRRVIHKKILSRNQLRHLIKSHFYYRPEENIPVSINEVVTLNPDNAAIPLQTYNFQTLNLAERNVDFESLPHFYQNNPVKVEISGQIDNVITSYLLNNKRIDIPNKVWSIGTMNYSFNNNSMSLIFIMDVFSRFIVGWTVSDKINHQVVNKVIEIAVRNYGQPEVICLKDEEAINYTGYIKTGKENWMNNTIVYRDKMLDNNWNRSFINYVNEEQVKLPTVESKWILYQWVKEYIRIYNYCRCNGEIGMKCPIEMYKLVA